MSFQRYAKIRAQRMSQTTYSGPVSWPPGAQTVPAQLPGGPGSWPPGAQTVPANLPNGPTNDIDMLPVPSSGVIRATQMPSLTKPAVVVANERDLAKYKNPIPDTLLSPIATSDGSKRFSTYDPRGPPQMDLPEASSTILAGKASVGQAEFYVQRDSHNYGLEG